MADAKSIIIFGSGGKGRSVLDTSRAGNREVYGFIDSTKEVNQIINDTKVLGGEDLLDDRELLNSFEFIVAISDQNRRKQIATKILDGGGTLGVVIHPSAIVSPYAEIGGGTVISPFVYLGANAMIGQYCLISGHATVGHDVTFEDGVQIGPGAILDGWVYCEERANVYTGAIVVPRVRIGARTVVGAGAVVLKDVPVGVTVVGVPARILDNSKSS